MLLASVIVLTGCTAHDTSPPSHPPGTHVVVFQASGSTQRAWASWAVFGDESVGPAGAQVDLPWSRTIVSRSGGAGNLTSWSLSVGDQPTGGRYECRITVDGHTLTRERGTGGVTCEADLRSR